MKHSSSIVLALLLVASACQSTDPEKSSDSGGPPAKAGPSLPSIAEKTRGARHLPGLYDLYLVEREGRAFLHLPPAGPEEYGRVMSACLYVEGLASGLGSNPVGLDRGQLGPARVVTFRRFGDRVLMEQPNLDYRATSDDEDEVAATRDSFATSVLWAGPIVAEDEDQSALIEITSLVVSDAHGIAKTLKRGGEGSWRLDADRSALDPSACFAFPDNVELEALLTFAGDAPGGEVRRHAPTSEAISLVQHHSFVRLPDTGYQPRGFDPRMGHFGRRFLDFGAPLDASMDVHYASRHRLRRADPTVERSPAVEPIVYYVDRGAPEPVRSALIEGASWWAEAFEAAGFEDAFRVELLPEGAHPLDVRYNVIQWVHRSTRGWSYGGGVVDPRTGEFVKGHVTLGSLRVRQDRLLFEGLVGTAETGTGSERDPVELALARIRQLAAHEVGHTLGLAHNFSASTYADRASVMDYPAPRLRIDAQGALDVSDAYGVGIGEWDKIAIRYLYSDFGDEALAAGPLAEIAREAAQRELLYHSDSDARAPGAAMPLASLWDNGSDPVAALIECLRVRAYGLEHFDATRLAAGRPKSELEDVFAPLWFHHRYQLEATTKSIGGLHYTHGLNGDLSAPMRPVPGERQRAALDAVLGALAPAVLDVPESVRRLLVPHHPGTAFSRERFDGASAPLFDSLGAATTAAEMVVSGLLQRERCARLVDQHRRDDSLPGLVEVVDRLVASALPQAAIEDPRLREVSHAVQGVVVDGLLRLASDRRAAPWVRERIEERLRDLVGQKLPLRRALEPAHYDALIARVERFLARDLDTARAGSDEATAAPEAPPGAPIGAGFEPAFGAAWSRTGEGFGARADSLGLPPELCGCSFESSLD